MDGDVSHTHGMHTEQLSILVIAHSFFYSYRQKHIGDKVDTSTYLLTYTCVVCMCVYFSMTAPVLFI